MSLGYILETSLVYDKHFYFYISFLSSFACLKCSKSFLPSSCSKASNHLDSAIVRPMSIHLYPNPIIQTQRNCSADYSLSCIFVTFFMVCRPHTRTPLLPIELLNPPFPSGSGGSAQSGGGAGGGPLMRVGILRLFANVLGFPCSFNL